MFEIIVGGVLILGVIAGVWWGMRGRPKNSSPVLKPRVFPSEQRESRTYYRGQDGQELYLKRNVRVRQSLGPSQPRPSEPSRAPGSTVMYPEVVALFDHGPPTLSTPSTPVESGGGEFGGGGASGSWGDTSSSSSDTGSSSFGGGSSSSSD